MALTNVFLGRYEQPENALTYRFLSVVEHLAPKMSVALVRSLLPRSNIPETVQSVTVDTLYGDGGGRPDGSVTLNYGEHNFVVFLEVKSTVRATESDQIVRHLRDHVGTAKDKVLVVIAANPREKDQLDAVKRQHPGQVYFVTWREVRDWCRDVVPDEREVGDEADYLEAKDAFLLQQFAEYLELEPYTGVSKMITRNEIEAVAWLNESKFREKESDFQNKVWTLVTRFRDTFLPLFAKYEIDVSGVTQEEANTWIYVYGSPRNSKGCTIGFGVRTRNQGQSDLPLAERYQPEFGVWVSVVPSARTRMDSDEELRSAAMGLTESGIRANIPSSSKDLRWLLCSCFKPLPQFIRDDEIDEAGVSNWFSERLDILFASNFLKRLRELAA